jgi:CheY-like chemotaxis protein
LYKFLASEETGMGEKLTQNQVVQKFGIHRFTLQKWFMLGLKYTISEGGHYAIDSDELEKFIESKKHLKRNRVLVIDDDRIFLDFVHKVLTRGGYDVINAENVIDGYLQIKTFKPDLIILDIVFPKDSGLDIIDKLMNEPDLKNIPVLCVSGVVDVESIIGKCAQIKSVGFLRKPIEPETLIQKLNEVFVTLAKIY